MLLPPLPPPLSRPSLFFFFPSLCSPRGCVLSHSGWLRAPVPPSATNTLSEHTCTLPLSANTLVLCHMRAHVYLATLSWGGGQRGGRAAGGEGSGGGGQRGGRAADVRAHVYLATLRDHAQRAAESGRVQECSQHCTRMFAASYKCLPQLHSTPRVADMFFFFLR